MKRSLIAAASAAALLPTLLVAAPAQAAGSCTVSLPTTLTINSEYRGVTVKYGSGCAYADWAWWDVVHPTKGAVEILDYDRGDSRTETMDWYSWNPTGRYTVRARGAYDSNYEDMSQNTRTLDVRLGSTQSASGTRAGRYVTLTGTSRRWSVNAYPEGYRAWSKAKVGLYSKSCASCSWKWVKTGYTGTNGKVTIKTYAATKRYFKLQSTSSSSTWGRSSTSVYR